MNYYPRFVYHPREDVTRAAMKEYDRKREIFYKKCEELNENYWNLSLKERMIIRDIAGKELGFII